MNGHLIANSNFWADASLEEIKINYDCIDVDVEESGGSIVTLQCKGYIGFELNGFWDETIIEKAVIVEEDDYCSDCWEKIMSKYKGSPPETGNADRNKKKFKTLKIKLGDGSVLKICATNFELNK